jgi:hypothetical protein
MMGALRLVVLLPLLASAGVECFPLLLPAQETGALTGIVTRADKTPLAAAAVSVVGTTITVAANTDGSFRINSMPVGTQVVEFRLLGYKTMQLNVQIEGGKTADLRALLEANPISLQTVQVKAEPVVVHPEWEGFEQRRASHVGRFFTQEEIARMQPRLFTDVLRRVPGIQIHSTTSFGPRASVQNGRNSGLSPNRSCQMLFYVNGAPFPIPTGDAIDDFIQPDRVAAVEVYSGTSQAPPQFNTSMYNNANCGVVVIWMRGRPDADPPPKG